MPRPAVAKKAPNQAIDLLLEPSLIALAKRIAVSDAREQLVALQLPASSEQADGEAAADETVLVRGMGSAKGSG